MVLCTIHSTEAHCSSTMVCHVRELKGLVLRDHLVIENEVCLMCKEDLGGPDAKSLGRSAKSQNEAFL